MAVLTNGNGAVLTSGGKAYTSGYRPKEWHLLVDYTTTEAVQQVAFTQGDNGEVFSDYDELMVFGLLQPAAEGIESRSIKLNISSTNAWGGGYYGGFGMSYVPPSDAKSNLIISHLVKTPMCIMETLGFSQNTTSYNTFITYPKSTILPTNIVRGDGMLASSQIKMPLAGNEFKAVSIGNYYCKAISADCRFIVYGLK